MAINRRSFIKNTAGISAGLLASSLESYATMPAVKTAAGFRLMIMATNWGFEGNIRQFCEKAKKAGYDGIEVWWPGDKKEQQELFAALREMQLEVGFLCGGWQTDFKEHLATFTLAIDAATSNNFQKPVYINCHSGKDYFSVEKNQAFINYTIEKAKSTGIPIMHETHRGRILYAAPIALDYIKRNPELKLTLDISHWCNVHESLLGDQADTVNAALERTEHIHTRVGHAEGPQVSDPRAPEWDAAVKAHFSWWDKVVERKKRNGAVMTMLTEFGPPDYLWSLPYTRQPVADQWAINVHMMQILRKRYQS